MINAGTSGSGTVDDDLNADLRPMGPSWDMGCYETPLNGKVLVATSTTSPLSNEASGTAGPELRLSQVHRRRFLPGDLRHADRLHDVAYVSSD